MDEADRVVLADDFGATIEAAKAGEEWAWAVIYADLAPTVFGYLCGRGAPEAEDLLGEVFLQMVRDLRSFDGDERGFRAWVFTIAHHRLLDAQRRRQRRPVQAAPHEVIENDEPCGDTEEEALQRLSVHMVRSLIARLPAAQQDVLLLRVLGGLTLGEVARIVGKRPGAVKALQHRALVSLRRELSREEVTL